MPSLGLSTTKAGGIVSSYVKDGLKLYMPYNSPKEVKFVGEGSTLFDGSNDYIDLGSKATSGTDATVSAWIYTKDANVNDILRFGDFMIRMQDDTSVLTYPDGGGTASDVTVPSVLNKWVHICSVIKGSTVSVYYNGEFVETDTGTGTLSTDSMASYIGRMGSDYFNGYIKNVGFWNRALSNTEVSNIVYKTYTDLSSTLTSGLVSWWALEESKSGDATKVVDSTGTNEGTLGDGATSSLYPTVAAYGAATLYGGTTPLIPRGFDNAPTVQADAIGTGYADFGDATTNYITFDDIALTGDFTVSGWYYMHDVTTTNNLFGDADNQDWFRVESATQMEFKIANSSLSAFNTGFTLANNKWVFITATRTSDAIVIYVNGVKGSGGTKSGTFTPHFLGVKNSSSWSDWFHGKMKNIAIWGRALTQIEILSVMEKSYSELISSEKTDLKAWWGMDSAVGDHLKHVADEHGGVLGSEILKDPEFNVDVAEGGNEPNGWQLQSSTGTWNISNGFLNCEGIAGGENCIANDNIAIVGGKTYKIVIVVSDWVQGQVLPYIGDAVGTNTGNANGTYVQYITATNTTRPILKAQSTPILKVNSFSVKEVSGNYGRLR